MLILSIRIKSCPFANVFLLSFATDFHKLLTEASAKESATSCALFVWGVASECFMNSVSVQQKKLSEQLLLMTPSHRQNLFSLS